MQATIDNEEILAGDLGVSTAPPGSPQGDPRPSNHDFVLYFPSDPDGLDATNQHHHPVQGTGLQGHPLSSGPQQGRYTE